MASSRKKQRRIVEAMSRAVRENPVELIELLSQLSDRPSDTPVVDRFFAQFGERLGQELTVLMRTASPVTRILVYFETEPEGPWEFLRARYTHPTFCAEGLSSLVEDMDALQVAVPEASVSLWIAPTHASQYGDCIILAHSSTDETVPALLRSGRVVKIPGGNMDVFDVAFGRLLGEEEVDLPAELVMAKTNLAGKKNALLASLAEDGLELDLTEGQWARVLAWVTDAQAWEAAFVAFGTAHASDAVTESQLILQLLTSNLKESFNRLIQKQAEMIAEAEKNQEKKLRRLTSDLEKMRTLTDGVRKRAERAERDNRKLVNELRQLKSTRAPELANQAQDTSDLSKALDAFF